MNKVGARLAIGVGGVTMLLCAAVLLPQHTVRADTPETPWGYNARLMQSPQAHADWCRDSGGQFSVTRHRNGTKSLSCLFPESRWGNLLLLLGVAQGRNGSLHIGYSSGDFDATDRAIYRSLGPKNANIEIGGKLGTVEGWEGRLGGRKVIVIHFVSEGTGMIGIEYVTSK